MKNRLYRIEYRGTWSWNTVIFAPSREDAEAAAEVEWDNVAWPECSHDVEEVLGFLEGVE